MSLANRSVVIGSYDAQTGDEVVTFRKRRPAARLVAVRRALFLAPLLLVLAGCGATAHVASSTRPPSDAPSCRAGLVRAGSANAAVAAVVRSRANAFRRPGRKLFARFGRLNVNGFPTFFRVLGTVRGPDCAPRWFRVQLPIKPNGVTGYVRAKAVETGPVRSRVRRRPLLEAPDALPQRPARLLDDGRGRLSRDADADRPLLRQPAADPAGSARPLRPGGDRHLGLLDGAHRLDAGRADRDSRDERALVDRACGLERLHPRPQPGAAAPVRGHARGNAGRDPRVATTKSGIKRTWLNRVDRTSSPSSPSGART